MKIFLDANILVSVLNKEYPVFSYSSRILSLIDNPKFKVYTSGICLAIAFYFAEKKSGREKAKEKIKILVNKINIAEADKEIILKAANDKTVADFEDGIEYYAALLSGCKCIITENEKDFYFSKIEVLDARKFVETHLI
jgi:predicted nucleic acid-binding protein